MSKITDLTTQASLADANVSMLVDTSDTSMDASGTSKKFTLTALATYVLNKITAGTGIIFSGFSIAIDSSVVLTASSAVTLTNKVISGLTNTISNISLTSMVTGILPMANGGTGATSFGAHGVMLGNGSSTPNVSGTGTSGQVLVSNGASADPTFQTLTSAAGVTVTLTAGEALDGTSTPIPVAIDPGSTPPETTIAGSSTNNTTLTAGNSNAEINAGSTFDFQTITIPANYNRIKTVNILTTVTGGGGGNGTIAIYAVDGSHKPTGSALGTTSAVAAAPTMALSFASAVTVTPGTEYAFVLSYSAPNGSNHTAWKANSAAIYSGTSGFSIDSGGSWSTSGLGTSYSAAMTLDGYFASSGLGRVIRAGASHTNRTIAVGFVTASVADGASVSVQTNGILGGFTGLTAGSNYYVANTFGTIATSAGTTKLLVGIAISTTQILIQRQIVDASL